MSRQVAIPTGPTIHVPVRDINAPEGRVAWLDEKREFPVGDELLAAARNSYDSSRFSESTMIRRYATDQGVHIADVVSEMLGGADELGGTPVRRFLTNTGLRPLFSPIVEDGLRLGLERVRPAWEGLIARTLVVDSLSYEYYEFDNGTPNVVNPNQPAGTAEYRLKSIGQGAPIPTARVTVSGKSYTLYKSGRGIEWTDEAKSAPIDLAALWFEQVGVQLGADYHDTIVEMLLSGYHDDGSDDAPVISTATPGTITDSDLLTAIGTMQTVYGFNPDVMLMPLGTSIALRTLENGAGQRLFPAGLEAAGLPRVQLAPTVPSDKIIFVDTSFAMIRFVNKEFGTEFDRSPQTQVEGSYGTEISATVPLFARARVILDA